MYYDSASIMFGKDFVLYLQYTISYIESKKQIFVFVRMIEDDTVFLRQNFFSSQKNMICLNKTFSFCSIFLFRANLLINQKVDMSIDIIGLSLIVKCQSNSFLITLKNLNQTCLNFRRQVIKDLPLVSGTEKRGFTYRMLCENEYKMDQLLTILFSISM